jgi:hypothetical protein
VYSSTGSSGGETSIPVNTSKRKHVLLLEKIIWPKDAPLNASLSKAPGGRFFSITDRKQRNLKTK